MNVDQETKADIMMLHTAVQALLAVMSNRPETAALARAVKMIALEAVEEVPAATDPVMQQQMEQLTKLVRVRLENLFRVVETPAGPAGTGHS